MLNFRCDYMEGAHPMIMERLVETNLVQTSGYGEDEFCSSAKKKIQSVCNSPESDVFFFVGGTQTNSTVIGAMLRPYEAVIATTTGHISTHEAGAIEANGHKVIELDQMDGKLSAETIQDYMNQFLEDDTKTHQPQAKMVYVSYPTEYGTLYSAEELSAIRNVCDKYGLYLYLDGARLGYGLASKESDIDFLFLAKTCDVFYIGGTKVGALFGEAAVFNPAITPPHFFTYMKQQGAILAKGRLLGIQFDTLFSNDLYLSISRYALDMAERIKTLFLSKGYELYIDSPTNQQFIILPNEKIDQLKQEVGFEIWETIDSNRTVIRFATSWATTPESIKQLELLI